MNTVGSYIHANICSETAIGPHSRAGDGSGFCISLPLACGPIGLQSVLLDHHSCM
eukprot:CAMPEP_0172922638 /NCGR_PEP_ID=MMETSP1075-20121228/208271_1 /TAXON_ID=2916 /ORGANISM="Ceratium fusus, Strain PA161109" /LENGTH=54 /DNA_ID=CAMNT_0013782983 /DNA_START=41 /DNA_END=205 /DNA_ORIENTATION=-